MDEKLELHPAEVRLIRLIRSIRFGTIGEIKVQDGLPVLLKVKSRRAGVAVEKKHKLV